MTVAPQIAQFPRALDFLFQDQMPDGRPVRYKVGEGGRGGAKTVNYARALLAQGAAEPMRIMCTREYQVSIKQSVHKTIADEITALGMNYLYEVQQTEIKHREHDTNFFFEGLHGNIDKIKSYANIKRCWIEEGQSTRKDSFEKLDPTIRADGSQIWVSMNPELETDFMYDFFVKNPPPDAIVRHLTWRDNPWFPKVLQAQMEYMKAHDYDAYLHVWEGQPKLLLEGAVYADELRMARTMGRICTVPWEPTKPVDVTWDLGKRDKTAIWLTQQVGFELRFLDYYENSQKLLNHYFEWLQQRKSSTGGHYIYGNCILPHDAKAEHLGTKLTIEEQCWAFFGGQKFVKVLDRAGLANGINAARTMFPNCYFDKVRCSDGIQALSHYRYEVVDNGKGILSKEPVHDEYSHGADAFRYVAMGRKLPKTPKSEIRAKLKAGLFERVMAGEMYEPGGHGRAERKQFGWMRN